ncbi:15043_t:CDS:1, partial [Racocetra fulgida]
KQCLFGDILLYLYDEELMIDNLRVFTTWLADSLNVNNNQFLDTTNILSGKINIDKITLINYDF